MYRRRNRRKVIKPRFYVIIAITALAIALGLYFLLNPGDSDIINRGAATFSLKTDTVVVRDEVVYNAESEYGRAIYSAQEGEAVTSGTPLAEIYRWGYTDDIMQRLYDIESRILELQEELLEGISNPELSAVNSQIASLLDEAMEHSKSLNSSRTLLDIERDLKQAIAQRTELLRDSIPAPEELVLLFNQETAAFDTLDDWSKEIIAAENGLVSFYYDGFELAINADKLDLLTTSLLKDALSKNGYSTLCGTRSYIYKIVSPNHWYIAFLTSENSTTRLTPGETYHVAFTGYESTPYTGIAREGKTSDGQIINILEFNMPIDDFLSIRTLEATIGGEFSGLRVQSEAVYTKAGSLYVTVMQYGEETEIEVDVLAESDGYALIRAKDVNAELYEGQRYVIP